MEESSCLMLCFPIVATIMIVVVTYLSYNEIVFAILFICLFSLMVYAGYHRRRTLCVVLAVMVGILNLTYVVVTTTQVSIVIADRQAIKIKIQLRHDKGMSVYNASHETSTLSTYNSLNLSDHNWSSIVTTVGLSSESLNTTSSKSTTLLPSESDLRTDPKQCSFRVQRLRDDYMYHQCDTLRVTIEVRDSLKRLKSVGGDYIWAWLENAEQNAIAAANEIIDHNNGTYTAIFDLFWSGDANINVTLVHPSEAVAVLRRIQDNSTAPRNLYEGTFRKDKNTVTKTQCHIATNMYINSLGSQAPSLPHQYCNFTDPKFGFPWFCIKPDNYSCDMYQMHSKMPDDYRTAKHVTASLMTEDELAFLKITTHIALQPDPLSVRSVYVHPANDNKSLHLQTCLQKSPPRCTLGLNPRPSPHQVAGYYYQDKWISRVCRTRQFNGAATSIRKCLKNTRMEFYGDSTGRQWFEYLIDTLNKDHVMVVNVTNKKQGPITAAIDTDNISLSFRFHGLPFTCNPVDLTDIDYIANRMDRLDNIGSETVIVISIWAHFWISDLQFYRDRLRSIKDAILRMQKRAPGTRVFFKTPNTAFGGWFKFTNWGFSELDRVLREEMAGFKDVTVINVWDMTIGLRSGLNIHPPKLILEQEVDILLSFICPQYTLGKKGGSWNP